MDRHSVQSVGQANPDIETHAIIGAALEVHKCLGNGFLEQVYQEALALELSNKGIYYQREVPLVIQYKGQLLTCSYRADFICYETVLVELKVVESLTRVHQAQVINYLKATGLKRAVLLNFGAPSLEVKRLVY